MLETMPMTCKYLHQVKEKTSLAVTSHHLFKGCWWARAIVNTFVLYRYTLWKEKKETASWRMRSSYFKTIPCGCSGKSWLDAIGAILNVHTKPVCRLAPNACHFIVILIIRYPIIELQKDKRRHQSHMDHVMMSFSTFACSSNVHLSIIEV